MGEESKKGTFLRRCLFAPKPISGGDYHANALICYIFFPSSACLHCLSVSRPLSDQQRVRVCVCVTLSAKGKLGQ